MNISSLSETLTQLISPLAASQGLALWGLELALGGKSLVRVYVEGPEGVTIDQCAELSRLVALALDAEDCLSGPYVLEVSSPGLDRMFFKAEQLLPYGGKTLEVVLHEPVPSYPGRKKFTGELISFENGLITLGPHDVPVTGEKAAPVVFTWGDARTIRLIHSAPEPKSSAGGKKGRPPKQTRKTPHAQPASAGTDATPE